MARSSTTGWTMSDRWTEMKRTREGVSLTLYEMGEDDRPVVANEEWWTWSEFLDMRTDDLEIEIDDEDETVVLG